MYEPKVNQPRRVTHELAGEETDIVPELTGFFERPAYATLADITTALVEETDPHELHRLQGLLDSVRAGEIG
jgi:hypothetical protein